MQNFSLLRGETVCQTQKAQERTRWYNDRDTHVPQRCLAQIMYFLSHQNGEDLYVRCKCTFSVGSSPFSFPHFVTWTATDETWRFCNSDPCNRFCKVSRRRINIYVSPWINSLWQLQVSHHCKALEVQALTAALEKNGPWTFMLLILAQMRFFITF